MPQPIKESLPSVFSNATDGPDVSVVIPLLNEAPNVEKLYDELAGMMDASPLAYEVIFVDDGSRDGTADLVAKCISDDGRCRLIVFTRKFGQTAALQSAIHHARGRVIVPMDGDLQNDARDIPKLVEKLDEAPGWDIVSGWRKNRQDKFLSRRFPSLLANRLVRRLTWTREIHDFGCMLKAYRREVIEDVRLYGEMHRFLPAVCKWRGARVTEVIVNHRPRVHGTSKYGLRRTVKVLLDLLTVKFMGDYLAKPIYFFGKAAILTTGVAFLSLGVAVLQKFGILTAATSVSLNRNVLILFAIMLVLMSVMFLMMGVISELLVRIYHEAQDRKSYKIRRLVGFQREQEKTGS